MGNYVLLNPHISDFFAEPLKFKLVKRRPLKKYAYLMNESIKQTGSVTILVNSAISGIIPTNFFKKLPYFSRVFLSKIEIKKWKKINGFGDEVKVYFSASKINTDLPLVALSHKNYQTPDCFIRSCNTFKNPIIHLSHYHNNSKELAQILRKINNVTLAADSDIKESALFKAFYSWYHKDILVFGFQITSRFQINKPLLERQEKAVATGTFHFAENHPEMNDFSLVTGANSLHVLRRRLYESKEKFTLYIDVLVSPFYETSGSKQLLKKLMPQKINASQKKYFSFDIVDKYNGYFFAVIGEEFHSGMPGIGSFEAMACGCVLIANPDCYIGIGMKPFEHFIPQYSNEPEEIISIIEKYKTEKMLLGKISSWGNEFVKNKMNPVFLYQNFASNINNI